MEQRQLIGKINLDTGLALLLGPMLYWHIFVGKKSLTPMPRELATEVGGVLAGVWAGIIGNSGRVSVVNFCYSEKPRGLSAPVQG